MIYPVYLCFYYCSIEFRGLCYLFILLFPLYFSTINCHACLTYYFAIPALGVKCGAYPGKLNQFSVVINCF